MRRRSFSGAALGTVACVLCLHWATSCRTSGPAKAPTDVNAPSTQAGPGSGGAAGPCDGAPEPNECFLKRAWLIEELLGDLYVLEDARDKRSVPAALDALATGEPDVQVVALRVLGPFASAPGVGTKVLPWLLADDPRREEGAAEVLRRTQDPGFMRLGAQFQSGHQGEHAAPPLAGWWRDPTRHGLKALPNALRFPPGDSARSIGLMTDEPVERVLQHYAEKTSKPPMDSKGYEEWQRTLMAQQSKKMLDVMQSPEIVQRQKDIQALIEEYQRTKDPKVMEKVQKLASLPQPTAPTFDPGGALALPLPPMDGSPPMSQARFLVIEEKDGLPVRAVVAYPEPVVGKTVVILGFSPSVYGGPPETRHVRLR